MFIHASGQMNTAFQPPSDSQSALTSRAGEILCACTDAFIAKGFDGASMQDLARAADMSAGNFYRYFPSKNAIIRALVDHELSEAMAAFGEIRAAAIKRDAFLEQIRKRLADNFADCNGNLWSDIEAAASRQPEIRDALTQMQNTIVTCLLGVFADIAGVDDVTARTEFSAHAQFIMILFRGSVVSAKGTPDPKLVALILDTATRLIDEISAYNGQN